ncbi:MAG: hypothetical protein J3K34DRAFT_444315 [Monoraphidium minutum]|nr:MAG: hypothetical protein J3K34DRAFT_444315 [Monoraphidium minutum]
MRARYKQPVGHGGGRRAPHGVHGGAWEPLGGSPSSAPSHWMGAAPPPALPCRTTATPTPQQPPAAPGGASQGRPAAHSQGWFPAVQCIAPTCTTHKNAMHATEPIPKIWCVQRAAWHLSTHRHALPARRQRFLKCRLLSPPASEHSFMHPILWHHAQFVTPATPRGTHPMRAALPHSHAAACAFCVTAHAQPNWCAMVGRHASKAHVYTKTCSRVIAAPQSSAAHLTRVPALLF